MNKSPLYIIVGLGASGYSALRFLEMRGERTLVVDTRLQPPSLEKIKAEYPHVSFHLGELDEAILAKADFLVVSPGIALSEPKIAAQIKRGIPVLGDIELFAQAVKKPVIGITGTNAKSTVTTLVGEMAKAANLNVAVGGNLGVPALDLLIDNPDADLFVLELSSFQLETTYSLKPTVATVLNVSPDHMDRYETLADYQQAKLRIYEHCEKAVINRDDPLTDDDRVPSNHKIYFTAGAPKDHDFGLARVNGELSLVHGKQPLLATRQLPVAGKHYQVNALSALSIGYAYGLPSEAMIHVLKTFQGLPHRCQLVRERAGVKWYNDSKGTNVGATYAAIEGLGEEINGKLILIAGGQGKNADFSPLVKSIERYARHVVLIGQAAREMSMLLDDRVPYTFAKDMQDAVQQADKHAQPNDSVLLSPACASFDMFKNFEHRGEVFMSIVTNLT